MQKLILTSQSLKSQIFKTVLHHDLDAEDTLVEVNNNFSNFFFFFFSVFTGQQQCCKVQVRSLSGSKYCSLVQGQDLADVLKASVTMHSLVNVCAVPNTESY